MKSSLNIILAIAFLFSAVPAFANNVETHLANIQDRVRQCSILPYTFKENVKVYHSIMSHCPEVKVIEKGKASVKVGGSTFTAQLIETMSSDGDYYDIVIKDAISNDSYTIPSVRAYGDVLLGLLAGNTNGVNEKYVPRKYQSILAD